MSQQTPHLTFVDVCEQGDLAIDALFELGTLSFTGGVQLMGAGPMPVMDVVRRMGQRHSLQMLDPLKKPLDTNAVRAVLMAQGNVIHAGVWTGRYLAGGGYQYAATKDPWVRFILLRS